MKEYTYTASVTVHDYPDVSTDERFGVADEIFDALEAVPGLVVNSVMFVDSNGDERDVSTAHQDWSVIAADSDSDYEYGPPAMRGCALGIGLLAVGSLLGWGLIYFAVRAIVGLIR